MKEVDLPELNEWYSAKIKNQFKKEHKILGQFMDQAQREIAETANALKGWSKPRGSGKKGEQIEPLDENSQKILERFVERISTTLIEIKIPSKHIELNYDNLQDYIASIRNLYAIYNETGKKTVPKFQKQYNIELRELDMHLRKIGELTQKVDVFLRKNYQEGKNAEALMKKIPRLQSGIEKIVLTKSQLEETENQFTSMKEKLAEMESSLEKISQDPAIIQLETIENQERQKTLILDDELKFKKALKKLKNAMEKGKSVGRMINENTLRAYLKNPVETLILEGPSTPDLRDLLLKLRIILEDEEDPLELKGELKEKMIENINQIINKEILKPYIEEFRSMRDSKQKVQQEIAQKGLDAQRADIKEKLAQLTLDTEHFENDLNRRKREYREYIEKVSIDREELQRSVKELTDEEVKIRIIIPT
jgi:hypothetical protein